MMRKVCIFILALFMSAPIQSINLLASNASVVGVDNEAVINGIEDAIEGAIEESVAPEEEPVVPEEEEQIEEEVSTAVVEEAPAPEIEIDEEVLEEELVIDEVNDDSDMRSVAEVEKKGYMEVEEDELISPFSRARNVQFVWIDAKKCSGEATIPLYNPENPKQQHSYLPCDYQLSEFLGVNTRDSNYYDIRLQGGVYAIHKGRVSILNASSVKSAPYYENVNGQVMHKFENNPTVANSYWATKYLGKAPSWMKAGTKYYSFSGSYFVDHINKLGNREMTATAVHANAPYYDYFLYMPLRTKTNYSAAQLNQMFDYMFEKSGYSQRKTVMRNLGQGLKDAENKYGVNALVLMAMAIHESAYGTSGYAVQRNNLFGIGAVDSNPNNAKAFKSVAECLEYQAEDLSWSYGDAAFHGGFKYYGFNVGTKSSGMNVRYASDPLWGESIVNHMYEMDKKMGGKDNNAQSYAIAPQGASVYNNANGTGQSYSYKQSTSLLTYMYPVVKLGTSGAYTKIRMEPADSAQSGHYSWNRTGYIPSSNLIVVQATTTTPKPPVPPVTKKYVTYETHVSNKGWLKAVSDGATGGTTGQSEQLEAIKLKLDSALKGNIEYRTHIQEQGWESGWKKNGALSGTSGKSRRIEALQIKLTGDVATKYDVYYRVHSAEFGWLGWAKNGASAGTQGYGYRAEAIQVKLVTKGGKAPGSTANVFHDKMPDVEYGAHVDNIGWQRRVKNGATSGTVGQSRRLEALKINVLNASVSGDIQYKSHLADKGWETSWKKNDQISGTTGQSRQIEAIQIKLTGELANKYDVYYRVHSAEFGWNGWAKNGASAGTSGYRYRAESLQVKLVLKGGKAPGSTANAYRQKK